MSRTPEEKLLWDYIFQDTELVSDQDLRRKIADALNAAYAQAAQNDVYREAAKRHGKIYAAVVTLYNTLNSGIDSFMFHDHKSGIQVWRRCRDEEGE